MFGQDASGHPRLPCHCLLPPVPALTHAGALACSWLGKMKHVKQLLVDDAPNKRPQLDALANAYIYLQVLGLLVPGSCCACFAEAGQATVCLICSLMLV